jgi:hypothetical protein
LLLSQLLRSWPAVELLVWPAAAVAVLDAAGPERLKSNTLAEIYIA